MRTSKSNANKLNHNKNFKYMKTKKSLKCSICGQKIEGFGHNSHPVTNGKCCDLCNYMVVQPSRAASCGLSTNKEIGKIEVIEFSSRRFKDVAFDYVKNLKVLTDYKGIYIKNFPIEDLDKAVQIFDDLYISFTSLNCDYSNIGKHMEQLLEVDILKELEFEGDECEDSEIDLDKIFNNL